MRRSSEGNTRLTVGLGVLVANALLAGGNITQAAEFPLKLSSNSRYLVDNLGSPFLIHGEAAWSIIVQLNKHDTEIYLEDRRQKGFNSIIVNLTEHYHAFDAPKNIYGDDPFTTPGDFSTPNEAYFAHADWVISKAAEKGIIVMLNPMYTGNDPKDGWAKEIIANGPTKNKNYGRFLGNRYKNYKNIIWVAGGDQLPTTGFTLEQNLLQILLGIKDFAPNQLWTAHWKAGGNSFSEAAFKPYMDLNGIYSYSDRQAYIHSEMLEGYNDSEFKPTYLWETHYEPGDPREMVRSDSYNWKSHLDSPSALDMVNLKQLFEGRPWHLFQPDQNHTVITNGYGTLNTSNYIPTVRASDGSTVMSYFMPNGTGARTITVDMAKLSGNVTARWFNPTSGAYITISDSPLVNSGSKSFTTPGDNGTGTNDWVLVLEAAGSWEHGGADFQSRFDKSTAQAQEMKSGALRVL